MIRKTIISISLLFAVTVAKAQFYTSFLPSKAFNDSLAKIVSDFKYNFKHITGDNVDNQGEVDTYASIVTLPGTTECAVTKYHSVKDTTASWQAVAYHGDDYKEAVKAYKMLLDCLTKAGLS